MKIIQYILNAAVLVPLLALAAGYFGFLHPAFDSLGHFRFHFLLASLVAAFMLAVAGSRRIATVIASLTTLALVLHLMPTHFVRESQRPAEGARYRLMQMNVRFDNQSTKDVLRVLARLQPDIVALQEVTNRWVGEFETIKAAYPYQLRCQARGKVGGVMIVSRRPFVDHAANSCGDAAGLVLQAIDLNGRVVLAGSIHLFWPWPHKQADHIATMAQIFEKAKLSGLPIALGGDFNAATWSHAVTQIADDLGGSALRYPGGSWAPQELPNWTKSTIGLPIDNFIVKNLITGVVDKGGFDGSDHLPLLLEFSLPAGPASDSEQTSS